MIKNDQFPVYLINLEDDHERRENSTGKLQELGITPKIITACNGHEKNFPFYQYRHLSRNKWWDKNYFKPGAFACYLSHTKCWKEIAAGSDAYALILEDDISIDEEAFQKFEIEHKIDSFDIIFVNFGVTRLLKLSSSKENISNNHFILLDELLMDLLIHGKFNDNLSPGGYGYFISKRGAEKLLLMTEREKICMGVDYAMLFNSLGNRDIERIKKLKFIPKYLRNHIDNISDENFYGSSGRIRLNSYVSSLPALISHVNDGMSSIKHQIYTDFTVFEESKPAIEIKQEQSLDKEDLVSVIIPCYNQAQYLEEAVESAINQTYSNIEIIIVNDGSRDNTHEVSLGLQKKYPKNIQILVQDNTGVSQARNNGIKSARGEYILPLDADDKLDEKMASHCMNAMMENSVDIVYGDLQHLGDDPKTRPREPFYKNNILYESSQSVTSLYRKEVWEKVNGYKQNMHEGFEDWEFWVNAYKNDFKFHYVSKILFYYRVKEVSRDTLAWKQELYLHAKIIMNHPELYTNDYVDNAIETIKNTEKLADLYFYHDKEIPILQEKWMDEVSNYLQDYQLEEKQILNIFDKRVALCHLDLTNDDISIERLTQEMDVDIILFYAPLRYEISFLYHSNFAWDRSKGILKAYGTLFPFVFLSERANSKGQLTAYKRLLQYEIEIPSIRQTRKEERLQERQLVFQKQVDSIRDGAIALEGKDMKLAHDLMAIALKVRPDGGWIKNKLAEYKYALEYK